MDFSVNSPGPLESLGIKKTGSELQEKEHIAFGRTPEG